MVRFVLFFFFKQKTAYELRISDWSSDVCSSDLTPGPPNERRFHVKQNSILKTQDTQHARLATHTTGIAPRTTGTRTTSSEERRVGKECGSTGRSRWSPYH